jgi:hypothetical protein
MSASVVDVTWLWPTRGAETTLVEMWMSCYIWFSMVVEKEERGKHHGRRMKENRC